MASSQSVQQRGAGGGGGGELSLQFKMVCVRSEKPICAPLRPTEVSPTLPLKQFQCSFDGRWPSLVHQGRSSSASFFTPLSSRPSMV